MDAFNLYNEVKEEYNNIFPDRKIMLVVFHLYQRIENKELRGTFDENEILKSIRYVRKNDIRTEQTEQFNQIVRNLQKFFLWRDDSIGLYSFRPFAEQLCSEISKLLSDTFNPTEIEEDFKFIQNKLETESFEKWYEYTFDSYRKKVNIQLSILDRKVAKVIKDIRNEINRNDEYDLLSLKRTIDILSDLGTQTNELNVAFRSSRYIVDKIIDYQKQPQIIPYFNKCVEVMEYFKDVKNKLQIIGRKIESLRPKLNEYINNINQQDFYRKFKLLLKYTIKNTSITKKGDICLPKKISNECILTNKLQKFLIIKENWNPDQQVLRQNQKINIPPINNAVLLHELNRSNEISAMQKRLKTYINQIDQQLNTKNELDFSRSFFEVIEKESGNLNIAIRYAALALEKYFSSNLHRVEIQKEKVYNPLNSNISVWKTTIYKKM